MCAAGPPVNPFGMAFRPRKMSFLANVETPSGGQPVNYSPRFTRFFAKRLLDRVPGLSLIYYGTIAVGE